MLSSTLDSNRKFGLHLCQYSSLFWLLRLSLRTSFKYLPSYEEPALTTFSQVKGTLNTVPIFVLRLKSSTPYLQVWNKLHPRKSLTKANTRITAGTTLATHSQHSQSYYCLYTHSIQVFCWPVNFKSTKSSSMIFAPESLSYAHWLKSC